jgi:hypothetical protein
VKCPSGLPVCAILVGRGDNKTSEAAHGKDGECTGP